MTKQIIRLNATALKEAACIRRLWFKVVDGYKPKLSKIEPEYGVAFHKVTETLAITKDKAEACRVGQEYLHTVITGGVEIPKGKDYLDIFHLTRTAQTYFKELETNPIFTGAEVLINPKTQLPLVEQQFSVPIYADANYEFLLQGTIDRISKIRGGCVVIEDFKTTASKDKDKYLDGFKLSHQIRTYLLALKLLIEVYPDSPLAAALKSNPSIGARIIGCFLDPKDPAVFQASSVFFYKEEDLTAHYIWLKNLCIRLACEMDTNRLDGELPAAEGTFNGACQGSFGAACAFANLCSNLPTIGLDAMRSVALRSFKQVTYEPLKVGGGRGKI